MSSRFPARLPSPESPRPALRLRPLSRGVRPAAAWWLRGSDPARWLEEIQRWRVDPAGVRLAFPAGASVEGVLALPRGETPAVTPRGLAFGLEGGALWLPCDAALSPPVTEEELRDLLGVSGAPPPADGVLPNGGLIVWHPAGGLMKIGRERVSGIAGLLRGAGRRPDSGSHWLAAVPVEPLVTEVSVIRLTASPPGAAGTVDARGLFGDAAENIGVEPPKGLPPEAAGAPPPFWRRMLPGRGARGASSGNPEAASGAGGGWFQGMARALEQKRWAALRELVDDLKTDPDKALRRAIPFGGALPRGIAPPGARLPERAETEFDIARVGATGRADLWNIPAHYHAELLEIYHELALREKRLGRWRRAAYIYAELLGDLPAAALVLKEGGSFRDAALLYRDHLRLPLEAAECLRAGGFHEEAAELYEREFQWEEAGLAWLAAGRGEPAERCFRSASVAARRRGDFLRAAVIEEQRRGDPVAALEVLRSAWPEAEQAEACLRAEFDLTAKMRWHEAAGERVAALRAMTLSPQNAAALARLLVPLSRSYPDEAVREAAKEGALERISELLRGERLSLAQQAAQWLSELRPDDTLLARDAARFVATRAAAMRPVGDAVAAFARKEAGAASRLHVKRGERRGRPLRRVLAAVVVGEEWYLLGRDGGTPPRPLAARGGFSPDIPITPLSPPVSRSMAGRESVEEAVLVAGPGGNLIAADPGEGILSGAVTLPVRRHGETPGLMSRPAWLPEDWLSIAATRDHWLVLRRAGPGLFVDRHAPDGTPLSHSPVPAERAPDGRPLLAAHGDWIVVSTGTEVVAWTPERVARFTLDSPATRLAVSPWWSRPSVAAGCERGAAVLWPGTGKMFPFGEILESPVVGFTTHGHVVAVDAESLVCAVSHSRGLSRITRAPWRENDAPAAILPAPGRDAFLIAGLNGFLYPVEILR